MRQEEKFKCDRVNKANKEGKQRTKTKATPPFCGTDTEATPSFCGTDTDATPPSLVLKYKPHLLLCYRHRCHTSFQCQTVKKATPLLLILTQMPRLLHVPSFISVIFTIDNLCCFSYVLLHFHAILSSLKHVDG